MLKTLSGLAAIIFGKAYKKKTVKAKLVTTFPIFIKA